MHGACVCMFAAYRRSPVPVCAHWASCIRGDSVPVSAPMRPCAPIYTLTTMLSVPLPMSAYVRARVRMRMCVCVCVPPCLRLMGRGLFVGLPSSSAPPKNCSCGTADGFSLAFSRRPASAPYGPAHRIGVGGCEGGGVGGDASETHAPTRLSDATEAAHPFSLSMYVCMYVCVFVCVCVRPYMRTFRSILCLPLSLCLCACIQGLHTFLLYLGPFIARAALQAESCGHTQLGPVPLGFPWNTYEYAHGHSALIDECSCVGACICMYVRTYVCVCVCLSMCMREMRTGFGNGPILVRLC
jgi:hypothetical protein